MPLPHSERNGETKPIPKGRIDPHRRHKHYSRSSGRGDSYKCALRSEWPMDMSKVPLVYLLCSSVAVAMWWSLFLGVTIYPPYRADRAGNVG